MTVIFICPSSHARITNTSSSSGAITINLVGGESVHFNSQDMEDGNTSKRCEIDLFAAACLGVDNQSTGCGVDRKRMAL